MKHPAILLTVLLFACTACPELCRRAAARPEPSRRAEEPLREFHWPKLQQAGRLKAGTIVPAAGQTRFDSLLVENTQSTPAAITVLIVPDPNITKPRYAIRGQIRHEAVEGKGYLEMWNHFPAGEQYFSRTLAAAGPMQSIRGAGGWRPFVLPFFIKGTPKTPQKLVVNVVLPGKGRVWLGPLHLVQYEQNEDPLAAPGQWWTERQAGLIGAGIGILCGCLGALIGILGGCGKARGLVLGLLKAMFVAGLAGLVLAVAALALSQPYAVYYPPLLSGILLTILPLGLIRSIRRRYEQIELRKMQAMDA